MTDPRAKYQRLPKKSGMDVVHIPVDALARLRDLQAGFSGASIETVLGKIIETVHVAAVQNWCGVEFRNFGQHSVNPADHLNQHAVTQAYIDRQCNQPEE